MTVSFGSLKSGMRFQGNKRIVAQLSVHINWFFIGLNVAMIEDPALFLPFGMHPVWLRLARLPTAVHVGYPASIRFAIRRRLFYAVADPSGSAPEHKKS